MNIKKCIIVLLLMFISLTYIGSLYKVQAQTKVTAEMLEQEREEQERLGQKSRINSKQGMITSTISAILAIGYIIYLLYYTSKLANKINEPKGLLYISLLIPLAGLILYCVYIKKNEELGKACGKLAILGITMPLVFFTITFFGGMLSALNATNLNV